MTDALYVPDESHSVISPMLYGRLRNLFPGGVIIANQGEGMTTSTTTYQGSPHTNILHSGEYYRVNCPFCADTRHRLWVNHMYGQPDASGRPMTFLATCYNENCLSDPQHWINFNNSVFSFRNANERHIEVFPLNTPAWVDPTDMGRAEPPGQVIPMTELVRAMPSHPAAQYMLYDRHYTMQMLDRYSIGYCQRAVEKYRTAQDRVVFPIYMHGAMVGWQARYVGKADWSTTPKYYGLPGMKKRLMFYNYDIAKESPFVVVVEGPTDANIVGDSAVALLGKTLSQYQLNLLINTWPGKPVVLILDPEAETEAAAILQQLHENDVVAVPVRLPQGYDCGDYDRNTLWSIIRAQTSQQGVLLPR